MNVGSYIFLALLGIADYFFFSWVFGSGAHPRDMAAVYTIGGILLLLNTLVLVGFVSLILSRRKGLITINFEDRAYDQGEILKGTVELETKSHLEVNNFRITFSATRRRRENERTYRSVIWQSELDLLPKGPLYAGLQRFDFSFTVPTSDAPEGEGILSSLLHQSIKGQTDWELEARLDVPGVDLVAQNKVRVNDGDLF